MRKVFLAISLAAVVFFLSSQNAHARRLLPRARTSVSKSSGTSSSRPSVSVKFRSDRLAIVTSFSNLSQASSVSYMFSYNTRGTTQGAQGSVGIEENSTSREIIFGTCSHGVCRYDYGISNAKFIVTINLPNGRRIIKTFILRV